MEDVSMLGPYTQQIAVCAELMRSSHSTKKTGARTQRKPL
jgi:hypothetical protein